MTFEEYVHAYNGALFRFASVLTGDRGLAEDVVQEVLIRAHRTWPKIEHMEHPDAYLRRMIVNEHLSWRRKWARFVPTAEPLLPPASAEVESRDDLIHQIDALPPRQRAAVVMRFYADLSDVDIAAALGCREVTVRGYVSRALRTLRIELTESPLPMTKDA